MPVSAILVPMVPSEPVQTLTLQVSSAGSQGLRGEVLGAIGGSPFSPLFSAPLGDRAVVYWISDMQEGINERIAHFSSISDVRGDAAVVFERHPISPGYIQAFRARIEKRSAKRGPKSPCETSRSLEQTAATGNRDTGHRALHRTAGEAEGSTWELTLPAGEMAELGNMDNLRACVDRCLSPIDDRNEVSKKGDLGLPGFPGATPVCQSNRLIQLETRLAGEGGEDHKVSADLGSPHEQNPGSFEMSDLSATGQEHPGGQEPSRLALHDPGPSQLPHACACCKLLSMKNTHRLEEEEEGGSLPSPRKRLELSTLFSAAPRRSGQNSTAECGRRVPVQGGPSEGGPGCRGASSGVPAEGGGRDAVEGCGDTLLCDSLRYVFSFLSFQDLHMCVQVNRRWRHTILGDEDLLSRVPIVRQVKLTSAAMRSQAEEGRGRGMGGPGGSGGGAVDKLWRWMHPALRIKMCSSHIPALLVQAAEAGNMDAMAWYADCLESQGDGGSQRKALEWRKKAARQGHQACQYLVGMAFYRGDGDLLRDVEEALAWLLRCVKNPSSSASVCAAAALLLGYMYLDGEGTERADIPEAIKWLKTARDLGCREAEETVGWLWNTGQY